VVKHWLSLYVFRPEARGFESHSNCQVLHLQSRVNSDTVSIAVVGGASERLML